MWVGLFLFVENEDISACLHTGRNASAEKEEKYDAEAGGGVLERSP